ncbi:hypothetical protein H6G80_20870 [Nostoc sp. FACHB-87]|nr:MULTISPECIES: hypothetical protein [Nostocales]MBD2456518.1 hypothetical protein [Nostoc sp. FACHB-87]MBD2477169.1 hypothetical protein [Anabaena sp. FACHB-83]MBD2486015.1 hypothetical protein [Aulosira sp. FACHB-615]
MQVAPRLLLTETLRERSATRSRVAEEAISISNFVKWYELDEAIAGCKYK